MLPASGINVVMLLLLGLILVRVLSVESFGITRMAAGVWLSQAGRNNNRKFCGIIRN
ncbi:MAG: hypothetical protein GY727_14335 [Gammaproteobacteria bacterium]|nr:hypothetical protein [Gammaproteobacteria bacterium]MCP4831110.1 hypothetical protein [Gammaproteobacteria bacterium]MCP4928534.1 hypothetical protein [Gammaproteobacteria bacterium]